MDEWIAISASLRVKLGSRRQRRGAREYEPPGSRCGKMPGV